jgi:predicted HNH restriction endonuclease
VTPKEFEGRAPANGRKYEEALKRLAQHKSFETVRNRRLVSDAKRAFKRKHGKLFCEVCDFVFSTRYGKHGEDYIEAQFKPAVSLGLRPAETYPATEVRTLLIPPLFRASLNASKAVSTQSFLWLSRLFAGADC